MLIWEHNHTWHAEWWSCKIDTYPYEGGHRISISRCGENSYQLYYYANDTVPCYKKYVDNISLDDMKEKAVQLIQEYLANKIAYHKAQSTKCHTILCNLSASVGKDNCYE